MRLKLLVKTLLMEINLVAKVTMNKVTTKSLVLVVFLQIFDPCFRPYTVKYVYVRFPGILCFLHFLCHFLFLLEGKSKYIPFYTKF